MPSNFDWWIAALKGERGPIHDGEPMHGYYRQRERGKDRRTEGPYQAVAYWADDATGELRCQVNGKSINMQRALEMWPYVSRNPISVEKYWNFMDHGRWDDEDGAAAAVAKGPEIDPVADPAGSLAAEIAAAKAGLDAYKTIDSDEQSAKAQTLRSALTALKGKAEKAYEAANRPLLDEQQRLRKVWFALRDDASAGADALRKAMGAWEDIKRENARRAALETARLQAEAQKDAEWKGAEPGSIAPVEPTPVKPAEPNTPPPATKIKGASGRAASVQIKKIVTAINIDKAFAQFRDSAELYALLVDLSQKALNAGITPDGATIEEKSDIR